MRQRGRAVLTHLVCPSTRDDDDAASPSSHPHPPRPMRRRLALASSPPVLTHHHRPSTRDDDALPDSPPCRPHPPRRPSTHDDATMTVTASRPCLVLHMRRRRRLALVSSSPTSSVSPHATVRASCPHLPHPSTCKGDGASRSPPPHPPTTQSRWRR